MNITEIEVKDRVLICRRRKELEVARVRGFAADGKVIVRDSAGEYVTVTPEQIVKKF